MWSQRSSPGCLTSVRLRIRHQASVRQNWRELNVNDEETVRTSRPAGAAERRLSEGTAVTPLARPIRLGSRPVLSRLSSLGLFRPDLIYIWSATDGETAGGLRLSGALRAHRLPTEIWPQWRKGKHGHPVTLIYCILSD